MYREDSCGHAASAPLLQAKYINCGMKRYLIILPNHKKDIILNDRCQIPCSTSNIDDINIKEHLYLQNALWLQHICFYLGDISALITR